MNEADEHWDDDQSDAVHELLHDWVKAVHAPTDLADRVEAVGTRRRTARWSVTGVIAVVAIGTAIGTFAAVRPGGAVGAAHASLTTARPPTCAANESAYQGTRPTGLPEHAGGPVMPGDPVAAVLCRYAGNTQPQPVGTLATSATVNDHVRLAQLQSAMNANEPLSQGSGVSCPVDNHEDVIVFVVYPGAKPVLEITYAHSCGLLYSDSSEYFVDGNLGPLLAGWTGAWHPTVNPAAG